MIEIQCPHCLGEKEIYDYYIGAFEPCEECNDLGMVFINDDLFEKLKRE